MKKQNKYSAALICLLVASFIFSPLSFSLNIQKIGAEWWEGRGYTVIDVPTIWKKTDSLFFAKKIVIVNNATLTIEKGANIRFSQGGDIFIPSLDIVSGNIIAEGTQDEKI